MGTLHDDKYTFIIISCSILLRMRNVSVKFVEKIKTYVSHSVTFSQNCVVYEIMWKNTVQPGRPQMIIQNGACTLQAGYLRLQTHTQNM